MTGTIKVVDKSFLVVVLELKIKESNKELKQALQKKNVDFRDSE